ncbi:MAG: transcriptional repressor NrdR [Chloroflexia bacterium]|nr:transcriptional repressor NrdR [Chloroflexia bacterium]
MRCPFCRAEDSRVIDSRELSGGDSTRRRRECSVCGRRFTTYERVEGASLMIVKKDGRRQEYDPVKLRQKLRVALTKRPVGEEAIDALLARVEADLMAFGTAEAPSSAIGESVLRQLKALDEVAYIRFASVYRSFDSLRDLQAEVAHIAPPPPRKGDRRKSARTSHEVEKGDGDQQ